MSRIAARQVSACFVVLFGVVGSACVGADPEPEKASQGIVGGSYDLTDTGVVQLMSYTDDALVGLCTGVLIGPRTVLTAAMCLSRGDTISAVFASDVHDETTVDAEIAATSWQVHPGAHYSMTDPYGNRRDVGLVLLASEAPATPMVLNRVPLDDSMVGAQVRLVGYGETFDMAGDWGMRRTATTALREYGDWVTIAGSYDANTCQDYGGPQLMRVGGREVVVSITDGGLSWDGAPLCRDESIASRVDVVADFIEGFLADNDTTGACSADGECQPECGELDPDCEDDGGGCRLGRGGTAPGLAILLAALWLAAALGRRRNRTSLG